MRHRSRLIKQNRWLLSVAIKRQDFPGQDCPGDESRRALRDLAELARDALATKLWPSGRRTLWLYRHDQTPFTQLWGLMHEHTMIDRQVTTADIRMKLKPLYPSYWERFGPLANYFNARRRRAVGQIFTHRDVIKSTSERGDGNNDQHREQYHSGQRETGQMVRLRHVG